MQRTVRVGIIDSGLDPHLARDVQLDKAVELRRGPDGGFIVSPCDTDPLGHGTAVALAVSRICPEARLCCVRVLHADGEGDIDALAAAIDWCVAEEVALINISAGATEPRAAEILAGPCRAAAEAGVIIIAAEHNDGLVSYPAHLPTTIGVRGGRIFGSDAYHYRPEQAIECVARGDAQRVSWHGRPALADGSSFAAPRITGLVARWKAQDPEADLDRVRALLKTHATRIQTAARVAAPSGEPAGPRYPWLRRAVLYPYTKEMHAIVRFRDLLDFEVVGVADPPGRGHAGADAGVAIGSAPAGLIIGSSLGAATADAVTDADADSLILGHLGQLGALRGRDVRREAIELALERGLHVFSFDAVPEEPYADLHEEADRRGLHLAWPAVRWAAARECMSAPPADDSVDAPVLGVFGTSASQGKFTLQLALRRALKERGYRLGQLGSEPHSELFGMDDVFPMGYAATVELDVARYPDYLDRRMRQICCRRRPELILVGGQSGTIPFDLHDHRTLSLPTLAFLLGTKPDACILVVNAIDPDGYVADTIAALRAVGQTEVIGLALSDRGKQVRSQHGRQWLTQARVSEAEQAAVLQRLEQRLDLPAVTITSQAGIERLVATILDHFGTAGTQEATTCRQKRA